VHPTSPVVSYLCFSIAYIGGGQAFRKEDLGFQSASAQDAIEKTGDLKMKVLLSFAATAVLALICGERLFWTALCPNKP
jgi:hypothetical protein